MKRTLAALTILALVPALAPALEIKNIRPAYGPQGPRRSDTKFLPGDVVWLTFDIDGLTFDPKTGNATYETKLEFIDGKGEVLFERKTPNTIAAHLGGARMPGDLHVILGLKLPQGKYSVKLTVTDKLAKESKSIVHPIQLQSPTFGIVGVNSPAFGLAGQFYATNFALVGMALDPKTKLPNIDVTFRVLDQSEKQVGKEQIMRLPGDLPPGVDPKDLADHVPVQYPIFLNRPGQFYMDIVAVDKNAKDATIRFRFPFTVVDVDAITGGK